MPSLAQAMAIAETHHRAGRLELAEEICHRVLAADPAHAAARHLLGAVAYQRGDHAAAITHFAQAVASCPTSAGYHNNLGVALSAAGHKTEAIAAFRRAAELNVEQPNVLANLARALREAGELAEAVPCYRRALQLCPDDLDLHCGLGATLVGLGAADSAETVYRRAVALHPPTFEACYGLGIALSQQQKFDEAIGVFRRALQLKPDDFELENRLGAIFLSAGRIDEALEAYRHAHALQPADADVLNNLGVAFKLEGRLDEALDSFRRALEAAPSRAQFASNWLYSLTFHPDYDPPALLAAHRQWHARHAAPLATSIRSHPNSRQPERRLRIGYVSPDFRHHVIGQNLLPLLREHDHRRFEIFCYSSVQAPDAFTEQSRIYADVWHDVARLGDQELADLVRHDQIDVLVDLTLHLAQSRLLVFARRPAPVQVAFAGYPGTTGLDTIDYRLTDPHLDPPGMNDAYYTEQSFCLADSYWCYDPPPVPPDVGPLPAQAAGHITFGCLNNFCKVNDPVLRLWAEVLRQADRSQLLLLTGEGSHRQRTRDVFQQLGIDGQRVRFVGFQPREEYLRVYQQIDVGLDTVPYNGHTTSLDALWMGVPVVTLVGRTVVGRAGLSQLTNLGLPELVAHTPDAFVQIAAALAGDLPRLAQLRATLRGRMEQSPLMDAPRFARNVEAAYRAMWRRWCAG